jgi:hypothetical protein
MIGSSDGHLAGESAAPAAPRITRPDPVAGFYASGPIA